MTDDYLEAKRDEIAGIDREIMELLRKRLDLAVDIGRYKADRGLEAYDPSAEKRVVDRYRKTAADLGMDPDICETVCRAIMRESVANETAVIRGAGKE